MMSQLWNCIVGPRLFRIYGTAVSHHDDGYQSSLYIPNQVEKCGSHIINGLNIAWNIGIYTSPLIITYLYKRNYLCLMGCISIGKFAAGLGMLMVVAFIIRGIGKYTNPSYVQFLATLQKAQKYPSLQTKASLSKYDGEFWAWPADFKWSDVEGDDSKPRVFIDRTYQRGGLASWFFNIPCNIASWFCAHCMGRHLLYPGSIHLIQYLLESALQSGRERYILEYNGQRNKLLARDGNTIDTMFIDNRARKDKATGSTLVICCEGNAGFYEVGVTVTPLEAGYSVLGWNHPGFGGSTGHPFPPQEQNAVDAVMQFAIHNLGFKAEDIIVYAWSIGGYAGTWLAMNYPDVRGLILDATFDDVLPLAVARMPLWMGGLVKHTVRQYFNLNNSDQLSHYLGPLTIVRRSKDEIITTNEENKLAGNRGNNLLVKMLRSRFPNLTASDQALEILQLWLSEDTKFQDAIYKKWEVADEVCLSQLTSYASEFGQVFPMMVGEDWTDDEKTRLLLFLAHKYMIDFPSDHNTPLNAKYFRVPWTPFVDPSYVQLG